MKTLCFALILSQNAKEELAPPTHIQELLKKRILYQIKQQNQKRAFYFDEATCDVVGTYDYTGEAVEISSTDKKLDLKLPYNDILEGKQLEISGLSTLIDTRENIVVAASSENSFKESSRPSTTTGAQVKRWLPWVVGAIGLSLGGWALYNSMERKGATDSGMQGRRR